MNNLNPFSFRIRFSGEESAVKDLFEEDSGRTH